MEDKVISKLTSYGSLFIGSKSGEVFGDYCSGQNHTLPTNGCAKYTGGLSVFDFVKILTFQKAVEEKDISELINIASVIAESEGLFGHKNAANIRK